MAIIKTAKVWIGDRKGVTDPIHISQYDTAWNFIFTVYYQDEVYEPSEDAVVVFEGKKADGTVFAMPGDFVGGAVSVTCPASISSAAGIIQCELRIRDGEGIVGTANFEIIVEAAPLKGYVASGDDFSAMQQILDQATADVVRVEEKAQEIIAELPETVEDWLEANVTPETGYVIDNSLTVQGAAADAKSAGDRISVLEGVSEKPITYDEWEIGTYNYPNGNTYASDSRIRLTRFVSFSSGVYRVEGLNGYEFSVFAWNGSGTYVGALMTSNSFAKSGTLAWVTSFDTVKFKNYKFKIALRDGSETTRNMSVEEGVNCAFHVNAVQIDSTLSVSGDAADAKVVGDRFAADEQRIDALSSEVLPVDLGKDATYTQDRSINHQTGASQSSNGLFASSYIDIGDCESILYDRAYSTSTAYPNQGMAFYDASQVYISGVAQVNNASVWHYELYKVDVPEGAKYARFTGLPSLGKIKVYDYKQYAAALSLRVGALENKEEPQLIPLGLHIRPENNGVLNVIKRCRQMTDIKWTPAVDLPRLMLVQRSYPLPSTAGEEEYEGVFKAGVEYTGIPYGRCNTQMSEYGYSYSYVGTQIGFDTFVTSAMNPDSKLCKESAFKISNHETTIYGAVCSALTCYALNVAYHPTASIPSISGLSSVGKINDNGTLLDQSNFKLGDVLNLQGYHTAIITDIMKDESGNIQAIELSDASTAGLADRNYADGQIGGICRRKGWTIDQIYNSWGEYSVLRYANIANVPYTPSPYVNVGDEPDMWRVEHLPVMPYEGDNFVYNSEDIPDDAVKLIISLGGYSHLRVFKDGVEVIGSPFAVSGETEYSIDTIDAGEYSAYLCNLSSGNVTTLTAACHWTID